MRFDADGRTMLTLLEAELLEAELFTFTGLPLKRWRSARSKEIVRSGCRQHAEVSLTAFVADVAKRHDYTRALVARCLRGCGIPSKLGGR